MRKIVFLAALLGLVMSCSNDSAEIEQAEMSAAATRTGIRIIDGSIAVTNSLGAATRFNMEIGSVDFIGTDNIASSIVENFTDTDFTVSSNVSTSYTQQYIGPYYFLTLRSDLLERIEIDINHIFTGTTTAVDQDVAFIVTAEVEGNITSGVLGTASLQTGPKLGENVILAVDLTGIAQQDAYTVNLYIDAVRVEEPHTMEMSLNYTLTNDPDLDFVYLGGSFRSVEFVGADSSVKYSQSGGVTSSWLRNGERIEKNIYESVSLDYVESPTHMILSYSIGFVDNMTLGFAVSVRVTDNFGNILGEKLVQYTDSYEFTPITVDLADTSGVDEYIIDVSVQVVPQYLHIAAVDVVVTVNNNSQIMEDFNFEADMIDFSSKSYMSFGFILLPYIGPYYGRFWNFVEGNSTKSITLLDAYPLALTFPELTNVNIGGCFFYPYYGTLTSGTVTLRGQSNQVLGVQPWNGESYGFDVSNYPLQRSCVLHFEFNVE
ncbi:MAG: hypothetical protein LIO79_03875 [Rikenellaceae bacterium]|nr:hypothetical protein [Rikenellaceae bacterium]